MKRKTFKQSRYYRYWLFLLAIMALLAVIALTASPELPVPEQVADDDLQVAEAIPGSMMPDLPELNIGTGEIGTGIISGHGFDHVAVEYEMVNGLPMFEGDIVLDFDDEPIQAGLGVRNKKYLWPDLLVPYTISATLSNQQRVHDAIAHWEEHTSIRFVERTEANANQYPNYVEFISSFGCWSYVGMRGGKQQLGLAAGCTTGSTIHEIGHVVGLWHEQSRADRDEHVTIVYDNIVSSMKHNFDQHILDGQDIGEYDYDSIMHYPRWAFSKNGKDTIVPKGDQQIGQRTELSEGDIAAVKHLYGR